jgi:membrane protein required for colicin V production
MTANWLDIVLLLVILVSILSGLKTGFVRVALHLVATVFGLLAGFWCYGIAAGELQPWIHNPVTANLVGFTLIFLGVMIVGSLLGMVLARIFRWIGLGWLDHVLGGAAGLLRGALLVAVVVAAIAAFTPGPTPGFLAESKILPYATQISTAVAEFAPRELKDGFAAQMERLKQFHLHQKPSDPLKEKGTV